MRPRSPPSTLRSLDITESGRSSPNLVSVRMASASLASSVARLACFKPPSFCRRPRHDSLLRHTAPRASLCAARVFLLAASTCTNVFLTTTQNTFQSCASRFPDCASRRISSGSMYTDSPAPFSHPLKQPSTSRLSPTPIFCVAFCTTPAHLEHPVYGCTLAVCPLYVRATSTSRMTIRHRPTMICPPPLRCCPPAAYAEA
ncbi:hypothetical protein B0H10DRAFT_2236353 [Mycena sp. CBHHK59/15]|nr:hypothetical protein B0H10DRAFT_2236353 [Mycena sp. CBHHK59/15]